MKVYTKLLDTKNARLAAKVMRAICWFAAAFMVLGLVLSVIGRQTFLLHSKSGTYENAIIAEQDHSPHSRGMTINMGDDVHIWTDDSDEIGIAVRIALSLMFAFTAVPLIIAYLYLSQVFREISEGRIFSEQNALCLLRYGMIQFFVAVIVPFIKLFICFLVNLISESQIEIATGRGVLEGLIPSIAFIVAAYIIHYGIHLQDEVDHTL